MCACTRTHRATGRCWLCRRTKLIITFARRAQASQAPNPLGLLGMSTASLWRFHPELLVHSWDSACLPSHLVAQPCFHPLKKEQKTLSPSPCFPPRWSSQIIMSCSVTILNGMPMLDCTGENLFSKGLLLCNMYVTSGNGNCVIFIVLSLRKY